MASRSSRRELARECERRTCDGKTEETLHHVATARLATARAYIASRSFPAIVTYHVVVSLLLADGSTRRRTYDSTFDGIASTVYPRAISDEERAHPRGATGVDLVVGFSASTSTGSTGTAIQINRPGAEPDLVGVPLLAPTYAFGLGQHRA